MSWRGEKRDLKPCRESQVKLIRSGLARAKQIELYVGENFKLS